MQGRQLGTSPTAVPNPTMVGSWPKLGGPTVVA